MFRDILGWSFPLRNLRRAARRSTKPARRRTWLHVEQLEPRALFAHAVACGGVEGNISCASFTLDAIQTVDASATWTESYTDISGTMPSGTVTVPAGTLSVNFNVPVLDDNLADGGADIDPQNPDNESFVLNWSNPVNVTLPGPTVVTIVNDTDPATVAFSPPTVTVAETAGTATVTVTIDPHLEPGAAATVDYRCPTDGN